MPHLTHLLKSAAARSCSAAQAIRSLRKSARTALAAHSEFDIRSLFIVDVADVDLPALRRGLLAASTREPGGLPGASGTASGSGRVQQKGRRVRAHRTFSFAPRKQGLQLGHRLNFSNHSLDAPMEQLHFRMFGRVDAPSVLHPDHLRLAKTYRDAVKLCWAARTRSSMALTDLAREYGFNRRHLSDYLNMDNSPKRRNLPVERIRDFEEACANSAITQWIAVRGKFTLLEEMQALRAAA